MSENSNERNENLRSKTIKGFKWSFLDNVGKVGGQFVIGIILTRLLTPADFGMIGMITIFMVIGESLTNSGFGQALVQKKNADKTDFSTVFYFNIFASLLLYSIIFLFAPLISKFYNQPQLNSLTKVICLVFIINAFGLIQTTHLIKNLDFKSPSIIGITSVFISGGASIFLAFKGFGVWALVVNTLLRSVITTLLLWKLSAWRPLFLFSSESLKTLFAYGSKILLAGLINSVFQNIYYLIIGKFFQAKNLGYYTRASQFNDLPIKTITVIVQKVTYPVFSTIQNEPQKIIAGYTKVIRLLLAVSLLLMAFIFSTSEPLIHIVLGSQWLPVVPYLKIMCLYTWILVVYTINNQIITVKGRSDYYLHIQIIDKILIIISILLTFRFGIKAMIYGHMVATVFTYLIGSYYLKKVIDISLLFQLKNIFPFFVGAFLVLGTSIPLSIKITNEYAYLLTIVPVGIFIYVLTLSLFKVKEIDTGFELLKGMFLKLFRNGKENPSNGLNT